MNLNKLQLIGRVTKDPELRNTTSGTAVTKFSLATNHVYKDKNGDKQKTAQFHNCVLFGKSAEVVMQYVKKGQELYVEGRIEYRSWDKPDGTKGYITEVMVEKFEFGQQASGQPRAATNPTDDGQVPGTTPMEPGDDEVRAEDIPF